jgi:DNA ligase-1
MVRIYDTVLVTRNARDKIQTARYILDQEANTYYIKRYTGQFGGKTTAQPEKIIEKGKAKRTTLQQAELEYNSLIKKSMDKGYKKLSSLTKTKFDDITEEKLNSIVSSIQTDTSGNIKPQLAKSSNDCTINIWNKPMFCSRKLDGVRCTMSWDKDNEIIKSTSRGGKSYDAATSSIRADSTLIDFFEQNPNVILDGELYVHGYPLQEISGMCRLKTWEDRCEKLEYWIYDYVPETQDTFNQRCDFLVTLEIDWFSENNKIKVLAHELLTGWDQVKKIHDKWVSEGFEGLVARKPNGVYNPGRRNSDWVKLKEYKDLEFEIVNVEKGLRPEDMCFVLKTEKGDTFKAKPVGNRKTREEYLENADSHIGQFATIKFFDMSKDNIPLQPIFKAIRDASDS